MNALQQVKNTEALAPNYQGKMAWAVALEDAFFASEDSPQALSWVARILVPYAKAHTTLPRIDALSDAFRAYSSTPEISVRLLGELVRWVKDNASDGNALHRMELRDVMLAFAGANSLQASRAPVPVAPPAPVVSAAPVFQQTEIVSRDMRLDWAAAFQSVMPLLSGEIQSWVVDKLVPWSQANATLPVPTNADRELRAYGNPGVSRDLFVDVIHHIRENAADLPLATMSVKDAVAVYADHIRSSMDLAHCLTQQPDAWSFDVDQGIVALSSEARGVPFDVVFQQKDDGNWVRRISMDTAGSKSVPENERAGFLRDVSWWAASATSAFLGMSSATGMALVMPGREGTDRTMAKRFHDIVLPDDYILADGRNSSKPMSIRASGAVTPRSALQIATAIFDAEEADFSVQEEAENYLGRVLPKM